MTDGRVHDPEAFPAVNIQACHIGNPGLGIGVIKRIAVVTDKSVVAADPDKAVAAFNDVIYG